LSFKNVLSVINLQWAKICKKHVTAGCFARFVNSVIYSDFQKGIYYSADQEQPRTESTFDETESTPSSENVDNFFSTAEEESLGTVTVEVEESGSESRTISGKIWVLL